MPTPLFFDSLAHTQKVLENSFEQPLEQEILLADYEEPVFKIVKTCLEHTLTQKYISGSKLTLEGFLKLNVYYQPPNSQRLTMSSQKIPFQKQIDLPQPVQPPYFIAVNGEPQYVNTRAQNPTRVDVRGAYQFYVKVYAAGDTQVVTAINSKNICTDDTQLDFFSLAGQGTRQFSIEDELGLPDNSQQILQVQAKNNNMVISAFPDKVNVKGEVIADIYHTVSDGDSIQKYTKTFMYNQVIDIAGAAENFAAYADFSLISFTVTQNPDTKKVMAVLTAQLDAKLFRKQQVIALTDAFSKEYEYTAGSQDIVYDENLVSVNKNFEVVMDDTFAKDYTVAHTFLEIGVPRTYFELNKTTAKAKITAHVIARNAQNEYECFTKTEDYPIEALEVGGPQDEIAVTLSPNAVSVSTGMDKLAVKINMNVQGFMIKRTPVTVLKTFEELIDKPLEPRTQALVLYYAKRGEKIFDIARRYRTSTQAIATENQLEEKAIKEDKMLFIPAFDN